MGMSAFTQVMPRYATGNTELRGFTDIKIRSIQHVFGYSADVKRERAGTLAIMWSNGVQRSLRAGRRFSSTEKSVYMYC
jgi:hypothetical protein